MQYTAMFKEVASLVFDIGIFLVNIGEENAKKLIQQFEKFLTEESDKTRKCRLQLNLYKLKQMLGVNTPIAELQQAYQDAISLDNKPEKGERKLADDYIVLMNE